MLLSHKVVSGKRNGNTGELEVQAVKVRSTQFEIWNQIIIIDKGGDIQKHTADVVLIATGRRPFTDKLGAKEIGVKIDK